MYLLMQMGSKRVHYNPLPLGITLPSVFQYIGIHIQFAHQNFKILQIYPMFNYLLWNFRTKPLGFLKLLLLVLSFRLIPKSRNLLATTVLMFPCWAVPTVLMSSTFPTFHWLLHLYLLNFLWVFMPGMFLNGLLGWMSHHWSTFLAFMDFSQKAFHLLLQNNRVLQNMVVHLILPFLYLEHLSKILLGPRNHLEENSIQVHKLLVYFHDQCAPLDFTFLTYEMHHWNSIRPSIT